jgi:RNA polymerase sigma-70 factor (ECF subfamily)
MTESDADLVGKVRGGDLTAFAELVRRHRAGWERFAVHLLGSREEAEDAMQDTLLRAYRAIGRCAEPARFRAWVTSILVNRCRTRLSRRDVVVRDGSAQTALEQARAPGGTDAVSLREEIDRALRLLPPDQREAFLLKHGEELSYDEIAEVTGVSIPALKMRVHRACERLRQELEGLQYG